MNIIDYMKWRGDLSFKVSPFNEVDNLIISYFSYVTVEDYVKDGKEYTVRELYEMYKKDHDIEKMLKSSSFIAKVPLVLQAMAECDRYRDCLVHDCVASLSEDRTEQFAAMQVDLDDGTTYIAFRGTDDTLIGWHEDFCLSYKTTESQISAYRYLKEHLKRFRKYRIGGHSKGGNLALYAVLSYPEVLDKVINIYSNDGPGINLELLSEGFMDNLELLKDKYIKIVPEFDVIGTIYGFEMNKLVVKSDRFSLIQHDGLSWQVEGTHFIKGRASKDSKLIEKAFISFLAIADFKQREKLVKDLFNTFDEAGVKRISDFDKLGTAGIIKTIMKFGDMNEDSKKVAAILMKCFVSEYKDSFLEETGNLRNDISSKINKALASRTSEKNSRKDDKK